MRDRVGGRSYATFDIAYVAGASVEKATHRPEIQGLRAIAVGLVVIFHLWPAALPGGYVGVDVFFVISGYLITGLLVRSAERDGHVSLIDFYSRRARRLLPAATVVLVATAIGTVLILPQSRWQETADQITASALYLQNWLLAFLAVDYLGSQQA
ncbi:acyltransferase family protein, partial [Rhizobiaceae sp. 2RAB30]